MARVNLKKRLNISNAVCVNRRFSTWNTCSRCWLCSQRSNPVGAVILVSL